MHSHPIVAVLVLIPLADLAARKELQFKTHEAVNGSTPPLVPPCPSALPLSPLLARLQRLLEYIKPDFVHIMQAGQIIKTGDISLVDQLELEGYAMLA